MSISDKFSDSKTNGLFWYNKSSDLHASAAAMWFVMNSNDGSVVQEMNLGKGFQLTCMYPVYLMLCGLSLELVLKAIIVEQQMTPPTHHDLIELAKQAAFELINDEIDAFTIYSEHIYWAGKYPTPKKENDFKSYYADKLSKAFNYSTFPGTSIKSVHQNEWFDWQQYETLWSRITNEFFILARQSQLRIEDAIENEP